MPLIKIVENLACAMTQALASAVHLRLEQLARRDWHPAYVIRQSEGELRQQYAQALAALVDLLECFFVGDRHPHADLAGDITLMNFRRITEQAWAQRCIQRRNTA